ncbi:hypothetical protein ACPCAJ_01990 [Streptomyces griseoincarnatus]
MTIRIEASNGGPDGGIDYELPDVWDLETAIRMCHRIDEEFRKADAVGLTPFELWQARLGAPSV